VLPDDSKQIPLGAEPPDGRLVRTLTRADIAEVQVVAKESGLTIALPQPNPDRSTPALGTVSVLVCQVQTKIVGLLAWRDLGEEAEILDLGVLPNHRYRGYASSLLKDFVQRESQSAIQKIFLEVRESNEAAIALYKKFGFQITGRRPNYYRNPEENALLMTLSLPA
jgi:ribosomal-protein-alanine acetyltransferase